MSVEHLFVTISLTHCYSMVTKVQTSFTVLTNYILLETCLFIVLLHFTVHYDQIRCMEQNRKF